MSNNKQSSLDYYITKLTEILGPEIIKQISRDDNERIARLEKRTKAMYKEEKIKFATDFFFWWYNQTSGTNTVEAVEKYYNETFGGNNEQQ